MAKYLMKAMTFGCITLDNVQCKKGDVFVVETLANSWPNELDVAKSVGKKYSSSYGSIPGYGWDRPAPGKIYQNSSWEVTVLEY
jgi:hypothetical protein